MHIQRIHYGKLLLILLFVTLCMTLVIYSGEGNNRNTIGELKNETTKIL